MFNRITDITSSCITKIKDKFSKLDEGLSKLILPAIPTTMMITGFFLKVDDDPSILSFSIELAMSTFSLPYNKKGADYKKFGN